MKNKLPDGWKTYKIKEIGEVVTGNTPSMKEPENYGDSLVWVKPPDLDLNKYVNNSEKKISENGRKKVRTIPAGSVLVSCIGNIGKIAIAGCELCTNQQINSIIPNEEIADNNFLYYSVKKMRPYLEKIASSAVVPLLNKKDFSNVKIALPSISIQKKIVNTLEKAEQLKNWRKESNKLTFGYLKNVFIKIFGNPIANPMDWEVKSIKDVISKPPVNGFFARNTEYITGNARIIWIGDFIDKLYTKTNEIRTVRALDNDIKKYKVKYGDILFVRSSLNVEGIGKASCIPKWVSKDTIFECHIIKVSLDLSKIIPEFFQIQSTLPFFRKQIYKNAKTATMTTISQSGIINSNIIVPPIKLQNKFLEIINREQRLRELQSQSEQQIDNFLNVLMQKAFRGELVC